MKTLFKQIFIIFISGLFISCMLHANHLLRYIHQSSEKTGLIISGPRTDIGDNYYYFTLLKYAPERLISGQVHTLEQEGEDRRNINSVSNSYASALYLGHALYRIADGLTNSSREAVLLTSIFITSFLATALITFISILSNLGRCRREWFAVCVVSFFGMVTVDAFANTMYFAVPYWSADLLTHYSNPLRMVNPSLFWAIGLFAGAFVIRWMRMQQHKDLFVSMILVALTGLSSLSIGLTLLIALGLTVVLYSALYRAVDWRLIAIFLCLIIGFWWSYFQLLEYSSTPLGLQLQHGNFRGLVLKWQYLLLLGLLPYLWRSERKEKLFVSSLLISAVVVAAFSESVHLGNRLWLRGSAIYAWAIVLFLTLSRFLRHLDENHVSVRARLVFKTSAIAVLSGFVVLTQSPDMKAWKGFVQKEKWEMLAWMDDNLPKSSVVASSDIEDAMLLPIYTKQRPLYSMYGLTNGSLENELTRYFYTMRLFGLDRQAFDAALSINKQDLSKYTSHVFGRVPVPYIGSVADAAIFTELVLYHPHVPQFTKNAGKQDKQQYVERLISSSYGKAQKLEYSYDYMIVKKSDFPRSVFISPPVYENKSFMILDKLNSKNLNNKNGQVF